MNAKEITTQLWEQKYFRNSKRQRSLFEFLLTNALSETPHELDQYIIAREVLARGEDFDPYNDSIVRSEISRLRKTLAIVNAKHDSYQFNIPKGRYDLIVSKKTKRKPPTDKSTNDISTRLPKKSSIGFWPYIAAILLAALVLSWTNYYMRSPKTNLAADCSQSQPNLGLIFDENGLGIGSYIESLVRSSAAQYSNIELVNNGKPCAKGFAPAYNLNVKMKNFGAERIILLELIDIAMNETIYLKRIKTPDDNKFDYDFDVSIHKEISSLLFPQGTIVRHASSATWNDKKLQNNYSCGLKFYDHLSIDSDDVHKTVINCLTQAIEGKDTHLNALGMQSQLYYLDIMNNFDNAQKDKLIKDNEALLSNVIGDDWIESTETVQAQILKVRLTNIDTDSIIALLEAALKRYPDNWYIVTMAASRYGYNLGDWERAIKLDQHAQRLAHYEDSGSYLIRAGYYLTQQEKTSFKTSCKKLYHNNDTSSVMIVNACAYKAGNKIWIDKTEKRLTELGYADPRKRLAYISLRQYEPNIVKVMSEAWENVSHTTSANNTP